MRQTKDPNISGSALLQYAVKKGGRKLDSFDGNFEFYTKNGFEPVSWTKFNEQYAPHDWRKGKDRKEGVIFFRYNPNGAAQWKGKDRKDFYKQVKASSDYDTAMNIRDNLMKRRGK